MRKMLKSSSHRSEICTRRPFFFTRTTWSEYKRRAKFPGFMVLFWLRKLPANEFLPCLGKITRDTALQPTLPLTSLSWSLTPSLPLHTASRNNNTSSNPLASAKFYYGGLEEYKRRKQRSWFILALLLLASGNSTCSEEISKQTWSSTLPITPTAVCIPWALNWHKCSKLDLLTARINIPN